MPFDVIAFTEATPGANGTLAPAGADTLYSVSGDDINIKRDAALLLGALVTSISTGGGAKIRQPSLQIDHQFTKAALCVDSDVIKGWHHLFGRPLPLVGGEKLNVILLNGTDEISLVGLLVGSGAIPQSLLDQVRPTHIIRGISDTTLSAHAWTACTIVWDQDLPKGKYAVVGMRGSTFHATGHSGLARLLIPGAVNWRPGVPFAAGEADKIEHQLATHGPWVNWPLMREVSFWNTDMPDMEMVAGYANTDHAIELLLQKIE